MQYFKEIIKHINTTSVKWEISYYKESDMDKFRNIISALGIDIELIEIKKLEYFNKAV